MTWKAHTSLSAAKNNVSDLLQIFSFPALCLYVDLGMPLKKKKEIFSLSELLTVIELDLWIFISPNFDMLVLISFYYTS